MSSIRNGLALAGILTAMLTLAGCVDTLAQSKQLALEAASSQISKLKTNANELANNSSSGRDLFDRVQAGDLGIVFPSPLASGSVLPGPTFTVIYGTNRRADSVTYDAVIEATGESGGGGTYHQSSVFLCLKVTSHVGQDQKTSIGDTPCRDDILELLLKRSGNTRVTLKEIPRQTTSS